MKKEKKGVKSLLIAIMFCLFLGIPVSAQTVDITATEHATTRTILLTITWTADGAGDATEDFDTDIPGLPDSIAGRVCYHAETEPGSTAPTALYDITISTSAGLSVFGDRLEDLSATLPEVTAPLVTDDTLNVSSVFPVGFNSKNDGDVWTFTVANAGAAGQGVLRLFFR